MRTARLHILLASALAATAAHAQAPSFNLVGIAPGGALSTATGLSADGRVAAGWCYIPQSSFPGFTWTAATGRYDFGLDPGMPRRSASMAISGDGATVVGDGSSGAFRWRGQGTYQSLGFLPGSTRSFAQGVSGDGSVVVGH